MGRLAKILISKGYGVLATAVDRVLAEYDVYVSLHSEGMQVNMYTPTTFDQKLQEIPYWKYFEKDDDRKKYRAFVEPLVRKLNNEATKRLEDVRTVYIELVESIIAETVGAYQESVNGFIQEHEKRT